MCNKFWVNLKFTCCCVRKGTPLLIPPAGGGTKGGKVPAGGGTEGGKVPADGGIKGVKNPESGGMMEGDVLTGEGTNGGRNPSAQGIKEPQVSNSKELNKNDIPEFRASGKKVLDIKNESTFYQIKPIEEIQPGDYVFGHDLMAHRVIKTFRRHFKGTLLGIINEKNQILWLTPNHLVLTERKVKQLSPSGGWSGIPKHHFGIARKLRKEMTPPERKLWYFLKNKQSGVKFRRQHPLGPYIVDFYSRECGLVIEVDGKQHFSPEVEEYDRYRDEYLHSLGLEVLRIPVSEIYKNFDDVLKFISFRIKQKILQEDGAKQWRFAEELIDGEKIFYGIGQKHTQVCKMITQDVNEDVFDLEVEKVNSYLTLHAAVHNSII